MFNLDYLRSFRILSYAVFDIVVSYLGIFLLSPLLSRIMFYLHIKVPLRSWLYLTLPIGILVHLLVGNITPMTGAFLDLHGHYLIKVLIICLLVLGLKDINVIK